MFIYLFLLCLTIVTATMFTIKSNNITIPNFRSFTDVELDLHNLQLDKSMNMYSTFTNNYFSRCDKSDNVNCVYSFDDQERACKFMLEVENNSYTMYYYGDFKNFNIPYVNYIVSHNNIIPLRPYKYNVKYEIFGTYLIRNPINNDFSNYKIKIKSYEPYDFYRQMMLYLIFEENKTISCPYWIYREEEVLT